MPNSPSKLVTPAPARVELTVKEYAARERVSERTVWVWLAKGAVKCRKTPGGGIRVVLPNRGAAATAGPASMPEKGEE